MMMQYPDPSNPSNQESTQCNLINITKKDKYHSKTFFVREKKMCMKLGLIFKLKCIACALIKTFDILFAFTSNKYHNSLKYNRVIY